MQKISGKLFILSVNAVIACCVILTTVPILASDNVDYDWWWVFYETETTRTGSYNVIRPLYLTNDESAGRRYTASLIPFVYWAYDTPVKHEWRSLLGMIHSLDYTHTNGVQDLDFGLVPFIFYGNSPNARDRYLLVWPLGGTIRGKLGQDYISAYAFPGFLLFFLYPPAFPPTLFTTAVFIASFIPVYTRYQSRDYQAWGILWPLIQRGSSPLRDDFRFLPFYSHGHKRDSYETYSFLLLFNYRREIFKDDEQMTFLAVPFFGKRWSISGKSGSSTLLWPFFSWGYSRKAGNYEVNFPWPIVQIQESVSPSITKRIFFPFYGYYRYQNRETFFLTPLYFTLINTKQNFRSEYSYSFLIVWYFKRDYVLSPSPVYGSRWRYFKIWPLFQYEYDDRGNLSFNTLSLLPWRDPEGYERLYQPFWTLFEYKRFQTGERRLGVLLRLYYQRWNDDYLFIKIPALFSLGRENDRITELSFLFSMFAYNNDNRGKYLRLFWIPVHLEGGNQAVAAGEEARRYPPTDYSETALHGSYDASYNETCAFTMRNRMILHTARFL